MLDLSYEPPTYLHPIPVGFKLGFLCLFTILLFRTESLALMVCYLGFTLLLMAAGGGGFLKKGLLSLRSLWVFIVFLAIWHVWTQSVETGMMIGLRLICAFLMAQLVTMSSKLAAFLALFDRLLWPLRKAGINTRPVTVSFALMIRFVPVFSERGAQLRSSWALRSAKSPRTNLLVPLAGCVLKDADEVAQALRARGALVPVKPRMPEND